jgi:hypothetical protein
MERKTTAEDVKDVVRRYCEENLPGWACAAVSVMVGEPGEDETERLLVLATTPLDQPVPAPSLRCPSTR